MRLVECVIFEQFIIASLHQIAFEIMLLFINYFTWEIMIKTDSENNIKDNNSLNEIVTHITHVFAHTMLGLYEIMPTIIFILTVK